MLYLEYMSNILEYIRENYLNIGIIVTSVIFLLVIIELTGIELNSPKPNTKIIQQVTMEKPMYNNYL